MVKRAKHGRVWKDGVLWVQPNLAFTSEQWETIQECFETIRAIAQDESISDSKCFEFICAEFAASYGILGSPEEAAEFVNDSDRHARKADGA